MKTQKISFIKISIIIFIVILMLLLLLTMLIYNSTFGVRVTSDNDFYSFMRYEKPDFKRTQVQFYSNKGQALTGYFYGYESDSYKGLICIAHGMGDGHNNYITEIESFANAGYLVFGYDSTGTNESGGKKIVGLSQSAIDLKYALDYLYENDDVNKLPLLLYGHSWGGFAVAAASNYKVRNDIKGIVSVSGFEKNSNVIKSLGTQIVGDRIGLFMPFVKLYEFLLFGTKAFNTGISGLENTDAKVLIIHSENDEIVDYSDNFLSYYNKFKDNKRFTFLSLKDNGHNGLLLPEANKRIADIKEQKENLVKDSEQYKKLTFEEYQLTLELDPFVLAEVLEFYDRVLEG